jgi:hypothetical protein
MNSECQLIEQILKGLMTPNNEERRKNESQLMELMQKNKMGLVLCLTQILNSTSDPSCALYAAVIARKLIQVPEGESCNSSWKSAPEDIKEQIKTNLMNVLIKCNDKNLKKKLEVLSEIYMKVFHLIKKNGKQF